MYHYMLWIMFILWYVLCHLIINIPPSCIASIRLSWACKLKGRLSNKLWGILMMEHNTTKNVSRHEENINL